jgi:hypothetical protein
MIDFLAEATDIESDLIALRREIHRHPELGRQETRTAELIERELKRLGIATRRVADTGIEGTLTGLLLIPVLFYTYNGALGKSPDWINISIFYVAAAAAFLLEWRLFQTKMATWAHSWIAFAGLLVIGILFVLFTFHAPQLPLFCDPESGQYGIYEP